jgi:hypothetical protein
MPSYLKPAWANVDSAEIVDALLDAGIVGSAEWTPDGMLIKTETDASAVLDALAPTSTVDHVTLRSTYVARLRGDIADHVQHLRDYRTAVRAGQTPSDAQTAHALADVIDALRWLNARVTGDE